MNRQENEKSERDESFEMLNHAIHVIGFAERIDSWEALDLRDAFEAFFAGQYKLAEICAQHALTPPDERSKVYPLPEIALDEHQIEHFRKLLRKASVA